MGDLESARSFTTETRAEICSIINSVLDKHPHVSIDFPFQDVFIGGECTQRNLENRPCLLVNLFQDVGNFEIVPDIHDEPLTCFVSNIQGIRIRRTPLAWGTVVVTGPKLQHL